MCEMLRGKRERECGWDRQREGEAWSDGEMRMTKKEGRRERQRWREAMKGEREKGNVTRKGIEATMEMY